MKFSTPAHRRTLVMLINLCLVASILVYLQYLNNVVAEQYEAGVRTTTDADSPIIPLVAYAGLVLVLLPIVNGLVWVATRRYVGRVRLVGRWGETARVARWWMVEAFAVLVLGALLYVSSEAVRTGTWSLVLLVAVLGYCVLSIRAELVQSVEGQSRAGAVGATGT